MQILDVKAGLVFERVISLVKSHMASSPSSLPGPISPDSVSGQSTTWWGPHTGAQSPSTVSLGSTSTASHASSKRPRSPSLSQRLRQASDLEAKGMIDILQKDVLKELILTGNERLRSALEKCEEGDPTDLQALVSQGALDRPLALDVLEDLDLSYLNFDSSSPSMAYHNLGLPPGFDLDDLTFDHIEGLGSPISTAALLSSLSTPTRRDASPSCPSPDKDAHTHSTTHLSGSPLAFLPPHDTAKRARVCVITEGAVVAQRVVGDAGKVGESQSSLELGCGSTMSMEVGDAAAGGLSGQERPTQQQQVLKQEHHVIHEHHTHHTKRPLPAQVEEPQPPPHPPLQSQQAPAPPPPAPVAMPDPPPTPPPTATIIHPTPTTHLPASQHVPPPTSTESTERDPVQHSVPVSMEPYIIDGSHEGACARNVPTPLELPPPIPSHLAMIAESKLLPSTRCPSLASSTKPFPLRADRPVRESSRSSSVAAAAAHASTQYRRQQQQQQLQQQQQQGPQTRVHDQTQRNPAMRGPSVEHVQQQQQQQQSLHQSLQQQHQQQQSMHSLLQGSASLIAPRPVIPHAQAIMQANLALLASLGIQPSLAFSLGLLHAPFMRTPVPTLGHHLLSAALAQTIAAQATQAAQQRHTATAQPRSASQQQPQPPALDHQTRAQQPPPHPSHDAHYQHPHAPQQQHVQQQQQHSRPHAHVAGGAGNAGTLPSLAPEQVKEILAARQRLAMAAQQQSRSAASSTAYTIPMPAFRGLSCAYNFSSPCLQPPPITIPEATTPLRMQMNMHAMQSALYRGGIMQSALQQHQQRGVGMCAEGRSEQPAVKTYVGAYSPESRKRRIERYLEKRERRVWSKKVKYDVRKTFANTRVRIRGRFIGKKEEHDSSQLHDREQSSTGTVTAQDDDVHRPDRHTPPPVNRDLPSVGSSMSSTPLPPQQRYENAEPSMLTQLQHQQEQQRHQPQNHQQPASSGAGAGAGEEAAGVRGGEQAADASETMSCSPCSFADFPPEFWDSSSPFAATPPNAVTTTTNISSTEAVSTYANMSNTSNTDHAASSTAEEGTPCAEVTAMEPEAVMPACARFSPSPVSMLYGGYGDMHTALPQQQSYSQMQQVLLQQNQQQQQMVLHHMMSGYFAVNVQKQQQQQKMQVDMAVGPDDARASDVHAHAPTPYYYGGKPQQQHNPRAF